MHSAWRFVEHTLGVSQWVKEADRWLSMVSGLLFNWHCFLALLLNQHELSTLVLPLLYTMMFLPWSHPTMDWTVGTMSWVKPVDFQYPSDRTGILIKVSFLLSSVLIITRHFLTFSLLVVISELRKWACTFMWKHRTELDACCPKPAWWQEECHQCQAGSMPRTLRGLISWGNGSVHGQGLKRRVHLLLK